MEILSINLPAPLQYTCNSVLPVNLLLFICRVYKNFHAGELKAGSTAEWSWADERRRRVFPSKCQGYYFLNYIVFFFYNYALLFFCATRKDECRWWRVRRNHAQEWVMEVCMYMCVRGIRVTRNVLYCFVVLQ